MSVKDRYFSSVFRYFYSSGKVFILLSCSYVLQIGQLELEWCTFTASMLIGLDHFGVRLIISIQYSSM